FPIKSVNYMFLLDILLTFTAPFLYPAYDEFTGTQLQQAIVSHSTQKPAKRQQKPTKASQRKRQSA
ncbi:MAG: hypothetical protein AAGK26_14175, partial [Pseudomonadota bacterium]